MIRKLALSLLTIAVSVAPAAALNRTADGIALVSVRVDARSVSVETITEVDGRLKQPRALTAYHGELLYEAVDKDGTVLFRGTVADPTHLEFEYFNEDGTMGKVVQQQESGTALIRVPADPRTTAIRVSRTKWVEEGQERTAVRQDLGTLQVQFEAEADRD